MSDLIKVEGQACLEYIDKPVGFGSHDYIVFGNMPFSSYYGHGFFDVNNPQVVGNENYHNMYYSGTVIPTTLMKWRHDANKRKVGLVLDYSPDGGLEVAILGNETMANSSVNGNIDVYASYIKLYGDYRYDTPATPLGEYTLETPRQGGYPRYPSDTGTGGSGFIGTGVSDPDSAIPFDDAIDFTPNADGFISKQPFGCIWKFDGLDTTGTTYTLTNDKNHTMVFGKIIDLLGNPYFYYKECMENPLNFIAGNLYNALGIFNFDCEGAMPQRIPYGMDFDTLKFPVKWVELTRTNLTALPFNLILTNSPAYAKNYLDNGTLPPDAFLYPLDWDNLPRYDEPVPTSDTPDDYPNDNDPDDDERDFDPTPNETPSYTVNQLTNYNWYWLTVAQWSAFISWFWNDIGNYTDFDDIIAKVKGLYNDVASAVIMCRYYPVDVSWIGGVGTPSNIKLGMIEKAGAVDTISQTNALRSVDIGHVHIGQKYKSFMDMSPYSQLSLYLPWHGFIDLDMNLFNGHDVYVKALYDYLSGTIQYYVFYDNEVLVNTILCKMAMDIPITLQTKNDRDSAIFNNVSSTIGGLVGAGAGILSGNPLGMTLGVTQGVSAFNSANASAPMRLMGNVGESGAYIGCQNCFVVVRRPTIQPSDGKKSDTEVATSIDRLTTWKKNVGMLCGYGYTLSSLSGKGFTVCHSPRINFTNTAPLQSEVDEIYNYLEKGVIL